MNRIQNTSTVFLGLLKCLLVFLPAFAAFKWIFINSAFMHHPAVQEVFFQYYAVPEGTSTNLANITWTPLTQALGFSAFIVELLPLLIGLFALIKIFTHYKAGEIFNVTNANYFRLIGWMFILNGVITQPISSAMMTLAITFNNPVGHRYISIGFGTPNFEALFCGAVIIVISWVMLEASKLHDEQQHTI